MYSFKDFTAVDYTATGTKQTQKRQNVEEALTQAQRQKMKMAMRKNKAKIKLGQKKAAKKLASKEKLQKRAEKQARNILVKKITKDKDKAELSYAARANIEKQLDKKKAAIKRIAKKLLPKVKAADRAKLKTNKGE